MSDPVTHPPARLGRSEELSSFAHGPLQTPVYGWRSGTGFLCGLTGAGDLVIVQQQLIHGLAHTWPYLAAAVVQFLVARWLWTSDGPTAPLAATGVLTVLLAWHVVLATNPDPTGTHLHARHNGIPQTIIAIVQLGALVVLLARLRGRQRRWAFNTVLLSGALLWTLRLSGVLG